MKTQHEATCGLLGSPAAEPGRDADVIILDDYPLNVKTWVEKVLINGEAVYSIK